MSTIEERVARGVAWLDENRPDWLPRIDLGRLRLSSPCRCVLGQVDGGYFETMFDKNAPNGQRCGFNAHNARLIGREAQDAEFDALEAEWRRVITERRAAA